MHPKDEAETVSRRGPPSTHAKQVDDGSQPDYPKLVVLSDTLVLVQFSTLPWIPTSLATMRGDEHSV